MFRFKNMKRKKEEEIQTEGTKIKIKQISHYRHVQYM